MFFELFVSVLWDWQKSDEQLWKNKKIIAADKQ
jgi:hypothetical protein